MPNLTLRTLLAYIDDTLSPEHTRVLGEKVAATPDAKKLIEKIREVTRSRSLRPPGQDEDDDVGDANTVAEYLSNNLDRDQTKALEEACLTDDARLAEVAACHQILSLVLAEPVRVAPQANQRMYKLVEAPASLPNRKPGKAAPVGGAVEEDDSDAALLLGLRRYSSSESAGSRIGLVATVGVLGVLLVVAVMMALRHNPAEAPPVAPAFVQAPEPRAKKPAPVEPEKDKDAVAVAPKPKEKEPAEKEKEPAKDKEPPKEVAKDKELVNEIPPPANARLAVGRVATTNVIVVTRPDDGAAWTRLSPDGEVPVSGYDQVMALPGYKADVRLETDIDVHLWGNVPEQLPPRIGTARVPMESRVRFHQPRKDDGFDADITVLGGRVYLSQNAKKPKAGGANVRVRVLDEVWDVSLPDAKSEVMVEVTTGYVPGTPFLREGGEKPRTDARLAVVRGTADITMPKRFKIFAKQPAQTLIAWDSGGGRVADPRPLGKDDAPCEKFLQVESEQGREVQKVLSDMAARLTDKTPVRVLIDERLTEPFDPRRALATRIACYEKAAITTPSTAAADLRPVLDALADTARPYARYGAMTALALWVAREPGNPAELRDQIVAKFRSADAEADLIVKLLFGFLPPGKVQAEPLDRLVQLLAHPTLVVRELALWNLVTLVDPEALGVMGLLADVSAEKSPQYEKFLKAWKARAEEIKKR